MPRFRQAPPAELDAGSLRKRLKGLRVVRTSHINEVERVKGRPKWEVVADFLENRLDRLVRAVSSHSGRILLFFHASHKYNLRAVIKIEGNDLKVVSYNWMRKKFKRPANKIPKLKWLR